jgi:hypothetical protein
VYLAYDVEEQVGRAGRAALEQLGDDPVHATMDGRELPETAFEQRLRVPIRPVQEEGRESPAPDRIDGHLPARDREREEGIGARHSLRHAIQHEGGVIPQRAR